MKKELARGAFALPDVGTPARSAARFTCMFALNDLLASNYLVDPCALTAFRQVHRCVKQRRERLCNYSDAS